MRPNLLIVCGKNKRRSRTAEYLFKNDQRIHITSVGLSPKSNRQIQEKDLLWADSILVMEQTHKTRIISTFRQLDLPKIDVLYIPDEYDYQDPELIDLLTDKINSILEVKYGL